MKYSPRSSSGTWSVKWQTEELMPEVHLSDLANWGGFTGESNFLTF